MANLTDFISTVKRNGFNSGNRYEVLLSRTIPGSSLGSGAGTLLSQYAESVSLPGRSFSTSDIKFGTGFTQKMPYNSIFDDVSVTWRMDEAMGIKDYFDRWQNIIHNKDSGYMGFYENYKSDMTISVLNKNNQQVYRCQLFDVYPLSVAAVELSHGSVNEIAKLQVTFAYKTWSSFSGGGGQASVF